MSKIKPFLILTTIFNHAGDNEYERNYPYDENEVKIFINEATDPLLKQLNEGKEGEEEITIENIKAIDKISYEDICQKDKDKEIKTKSDLFFNILKVFTEKLKQQNETRKSQTNYFHYKNREHCYTTQINAKIGIMFTSDTHAEADEVEKILFLFDKMKNDGKVDKMVFLGDYGDRGPNWAYTYFLLTAMAGKYGEDILFIRGNHEDKEIARGYGDLIKTLFWADTVSKKDLFVFLNNCWEKMPVLGEIEYNQKKIFCSHGAMPLNNACEWIETEKGENYPNFLGNWNSNNFDEEKETNPTKSERGEGYEIPIKTIFDQMEKGGYAWSIHGHVHKNQCGISEDQKKRVVTVVANKYDYDCGKSAFLPAVYIINDENPNGTFFNLLNVKNKKIKDYYKEKQKNREVLNNCVIYEYDNEIIYQDKINKKKEKCDHNTRKKISCCCDICKKWWKSR